MKNNQPLVSIITVVLNGVKTIEQTIQSVVNQTYSNIEYIVIDGNSMDGTVDVIKKYSNRINYWISEPDRGSYDAMNKGVGVATGEYIGIIHADDWYDLKAVENIVREIESTNADVIYGNIIFENQNPKMLKPKNDLSELKSSMILFHPSIFVKRTIYNQYGVFNCNYSIAADWKLLLRLYLAKCKFVHCDSVIAHFRVNGASSDFTFSQILERGKIRKVNKRKWLWLFVKDLLIYVVFKLKLKNPYD